MSGSIQIHRSLSLYQNSNELGQLQELFVRSFGLFLHCYLTTHPIAIDCKTACDMHYRHLQSLSLLFSSDRFTLTNVESLKPFLRYAQKYTLPFDFSEYIYFLVLFLGQFYEERFNIAFAFCCCWIGGAEYLNPSRIVFECKSFVFL